MAAYTTIDDPSAHFQTQLYTGNYSDAHAITFDDTDTTMQPDLVVAKQRDGADAWYCSDVVRGVTKTVYWDVTTAEETIAEGIQAFGSDGFTVGQTNAINQSSAANVAYCWKAGGGSGSSYEDGSINTTSTSVNTTSKCSISTYTGTGSTATVGHGIGVTPSLIITKSRGGGFQWAVYHHKVASDPETDYLYLDTTAAATDDINVWNDTAPTSTVFTVETSNRTNASSGTYVAYVWADVQGFSKFGSYTGNGDNDGAFVYTGFRPAMVIYKKSSGTENWFAHDNKRQGYNPDNEYLFPDLSNAEGTVNRIDLLSNGFKATTSDGGINASGATYIYMAFAEAPFVNSNGVPCNAK
jgi:hypothetical protein